MPLATQKAKTALSCIGLHGSRENGRETGSTKLSKLTKLPAAKETIRQAKADDTVTVATHTASRR